MMKIAFTDKPATCPQCKQGVAMGGVCTLDEYIVYLGDSLWEHTKKLTAAPKPADLAVAEQMRRNIETIVNCMSVARQLRP